MTRYKRATDLALSAIALAFSAPVLVAAALVIKLDDGGPVFFKQARLGQNGRTILILKLRTMRSDASDMRNPDGSTYSGANDPRVTRAGRYLRRWSVDELPQLFNVLRGDLSLVGPRPDLPDQLRFYRPVDYDRLSISPGLTGLAQVSGRNALTWEHRRDLDLEYLRKQSWLFDLSILIRTLPLLVTSRGVTQVEAGTAKVADET